MTHEKAKQYYYLFKDIKDAHRANGYMSLRSLEKEVLTSLRFYMAELGCLALLGKYHQWWEVDLSDESVKKAQIIIDGFISEKSIIRSPGKIYVPAWDESWAIKEAKLMQQTFQFKGRVCDIEPIASGTSTKGTTWKRRTFAVEEEGQYPNLVAFSLSGEKCETTDLRLGDVVEVDFQVASRRHNDRYFTEAKVIAVRSKK